jgi:hypothetical protein
MRGLRDPLVKALVVVQGQELGFQGGVAQLFGRPTGGGGRVIEFVGEACRELAEGRKLLVLAVRALRIAHALG